MTTYYIHATGGNDANNGLTAGAAWSTLAYADSQVSAGDTVWLSPGCHFIHAPFQLTTTGTSGFPIQYKGDFLGVIFSMERGEVLLDTSLRLTGADSFVNTYLSGMLYNGNVYNSADAYLIQSEGTRYIEFHNVIFGHPPGREGDAIIILSVGSSGVTEYAAEGWKFIECSFTGKAFRNYPVVVQLNCEKTDADVSDGDGLLFDRCALGGIIKLFFDESSIQELDMKVLIRSCVFIGTGSQIYAGRGVNDTYEVSGLHVYNCTFVGSDPFFFSYALRTSRYFFNNLLLGATTNVGYHASYSEWLGGNRKNYMGNEWAVLRFHDTDNFSLRNLALSIGGMGDTIHRSIFGWSPWLPFEPINHGGQKTYGAGAFNLDVSGTYDFYGYPLTEAEGIGFFMVTGAYEAIAAGSDWSGTPDGEFIFDTNIGTASTSGSGPTEVQLAGLDLTGIQGFCDDIVGVVFFLRVNRTAVPSTLNIEYLSESLVTDYEWDSLIDSQASLMLVPATPAGGWTTDVLEKLRIRVQMTSTSLNYMYGFAIAARMKHSNAVGAISGPAKLIEETAITRSGSSGRLGAWSWWQKPMYLSAGAYTFTVYARYNSTYSGTLPTLEVVIPEDDVSHSDVVTGSADSWEQLSVSFTLTEARTVVLKLRSYNTVEGGYCYFDDLETA